MSKTKKPETQSEWVDYLGEVAKERHSGAVYFSAYVIRAFCKNYVGWEYDDMNEPQKALIRACMVSYATKSWGQSSVIQDANSINDSLVYYL